MLNPLFWLQAISLAFSQIWANKSRAFLTALGIIVGVASTTAVIAALTGLKAKVLAEFESVGASKFFVFPDRPDNAPRNMYPWEKILLKTAEVRAIRDECTLVKAITPITEVGLDVESGDKRIEGITVAGIWPDWHVVQNRFVVEGRPFSQIDEDSERQVCLINADAIRELDLAANPVGEPVLIGGRRFMVVGVVETTTARFFGMNTSSAEIFIPFSVAEKMQERNFFMRIEGLFSNPETALEGEDEVRFVLRRMRGIAPGELETFRVAAIDKFIEQFKTLAAGITAIAGGIVGISLLVGGIGIMNIMLVSVSERTREIGLRKAVGATPTAILLQFLLEAVTLCLVGGFIGIAFGRLAAFGLTKIPGAQLDQADIPFWAVVVSFAFSALTGVVFGMFPAIKAARLDPIEALRHE
ncbi:MAG: Macrolide export ATP-binding/permease protein MacB [Planctomycetota bacterium]|jgi:putative ABC transport system permease protein